MVIQDGRGIKAEMIKTQNLQNAYVSITDDDDDDDDDNDDNELILVVWLSDETCLPLYPAGAFMLVRDAQHSESLTPC